MSRKITVFTGTRADYGLLRGVIDAIARNQSVALSILVSGAHLSNAYGNTLAEIDQDGYASIYKVDMKLVDNSPVGICASMGRAMEGYGKALRDLQPDLLVVLGDRYEAFCAASVATVMRIPVAHLYGGGTSLGAIDENFRHAITKMSHLHFVSCEVNRQRVVQMGENPDHIWLVGSSGVENTYTLPVLDERDVRKRLQLPENVPYVVVTYHPVTLESQSSKTHVDNLLEVLRAQEDWYYVFTGSNADAGAEEINMFLRKEALRDSKMRFFMSLGAELYINAGRYADAVIGNSSSGVAEIPSLGIPVLDIGNRQKGRERSVAVLHCSERKEDIASAVACLRQPETAEKARTTKNPLDIPGTSAQIASVLTSFPLEGLLEKNIPHTEETKRRAHILRDEADTARGNKMISTLRKLCKKSSVLEDGYVSNSSEQEAVVENSAASLG